MVYYHTIYPSASVDLVCVMMTPQRPSLATIVTQKCLRVSELSSASMGGHVICLYLFCCICYVCCAHSYMVSSFDCRGKGVYRPNMELLGKITPRENEGMDDYRRAVINTLKSNKSDGSFGGREILELLVKKWGVGTSFTTSVFLLPSLTCSNRVYF